MNFASQKGARCLGALEGEVELPAGIDLEGIADTDQMIVCTC